MKSGRPPPLTLSARSVARNRPGVLRFPSLAGFDKAFLVLVPCPEATTLS